MIAFVEGLLAAFGMVDFGFGNTDFVAAFGTDFVAAFGDANFAATFDEIRFSLGSTCFAVF